MKFTPFFILLSLSMLQLISCNGQEIDKQKLFGNWSIKNKDDGTVNYLEIFINDSKMYYYDINVGLRPSSKYYIENGSIFHSQLNSEYEKIGEIFLNDDVLTIKGSGKVLLLKKISGTQTLGRFVNKEIEKDVFWAAYLQRYEKWTKESK